MSDPRPSPTPIRAVYGFVLYISSLTLLLLYTLWAILPESLLENTLPFLPQKYWAFAGPIYAGVAFVFFLFILYPNLHYLRSQ